MPHGHCYLWQTPLVWLHVVSDALVAVAYFSIPAMLVYFVRKRGDIPFSRVFILFGAFIVLCGTGHLLDIWTLWFPAYWLSGVERALTALVSCYTALQLVELLPKFLALRTPDQLETLNQELKKQVEERQRAEETLRMIVTGTASVTGKDFFPVLAKNLAAALKVPYVMISERVGHSAESLQTLAIWSIDQFSENFQFPVAGTACGKVLQTGKLYAIEQGLQQVFPEAQFLQKRGLQSYAGVPLWGMNQEVIGTLCILDQVPRTMDSYTEALLSVFSARAATELQRQWAEDEKRLAYEELEFRVEERTAALVATNAALESEIRERILAEKALQQSQEQFSKAFHSNPIACCISTLQDGRFLDVNSSFLKLFGYCREEVIGHTSAELNIWADPADRDRLIQALKQQQSVQQDAPFRGRSGQVREGMASFEKIELQGEICLLSMIYDFTDRKQAEAEQLQQMKLAALRAEVGMALTEGESLQEVLDRCAIALYQHLDAAFARIWTFDPSEQVLLLKASAGLYTHLNGGHSRIPLGQFKIGRIAQQQQPYLTNQVVDDPHIDQAWARREGMVAFAGYPLAIKNRLLGVIAIFACHPLAERTLKEMAAVASTIAVGIDRKLAEEALRQMFERERTVARVLQRMRDTLELTTIFRTTTTELRRAIACDRTLIYRFNADWSGQVIAESVAAGWNTIVPVQPEVADLTLVTLDQGDCIVKQLDGSEVLIRDTYLQATAGGRYQQLNCCCVRDVYQQGFDPCYLELLEYLQARAYLIVPIFCGSYLWGLLATYQNTAPREWQPGEIQMVSKIGSQLGVAVQQAELFMQTQQQAEELRQAKEAADLANRTKTEFLANMSHELRTPLNVILGLTQLMGRDRALTAEYQQYLETIGNSGEHLLELINDVLEMSKVEAGALTFNQTAFNLHQLLNTLKDMMHFRAIAKGLRLRFEYNSDLPQFIKTDEGKLRQIIINLLGNAIKFTTQGGITLRARPVSAIEAQKVRCHPEVNGFSSEDENTCAILFEVEDTGPGIAAEDLKRLFKPFQQTGAGLSASEGTGLGLAISQKYAQILGGEIIAQSQPGQGSCFTFCICATLTSSVELKTASPALTGRVVGLAPEQPSYRILIAEDNPTNRLLLTKLLSSVGFELKEAINGQEAVELWQSWQPDLIFMDMRMPLLTGQEATQQIRVLENQRADRTITGTKILALTASAFLEQRDEMLAAGCDDFICKPFKAQDIFEKIAYHLDVKYLYEALPESTSPSSRPQLAATSGFDWLKQMPGSWLDRLYQAASRGSDLEVLNLMQEVPVELTPYTTGVKALAENFQFEKIIEALAPLQPAPDLL